MQREVGPLMIPLRHIPQPPPVCVSRSPMSRVFVQAIPVLVVEEICNGSRSQYKRPVLHQQRDDLVSQHVARPIYPVMRYSILGPDKGST